MCIVCVIWLNILTDVWIHCTLGFTTICIGCVA